MISNKKINKNGITNYVIHFFKVEYKLYFLYSFLLGIPFLIVLLYNNSSHYDVQDNVLYSLQNLSKKLITISITLLYFGIQTSFGILYIKNTEQNKSITSVLIKTLIYSIPTTIIIGFGFGVYELIIIVNNIIPILANLLVFNLIGAIIFGLFFLFAILFLIDANKSVSIFIYTIKNKTLNILNTITALIIALVLTLYTVPTILSLLNYITNLVLGISLSNNILKNISAIFTFLAVYIVLHFITIRLYIICNGISDQFKLEVDGNNINQIGLNTNDQNDDELI